MAVNISTDTNTIKVLTTTNTVKVVDNRTNTTVKVNQPTTKVIKVATVGPQGQSGEQGLTGPSGSQGPQGIQGIQGLPGPSGSQGPQGEKGDTGLGFTIAKIYSSVAALESDTSPTGIQSGQFAIIETGNVQDEDNSKIYLWEGVQYTYISDLSGTAGIQGIQGEPGPSGSQGPQGEPGPSGSQGPQGEQGIPGTSVDSGSFVSTGSFNDFTSSFTLISESFDLRILQITSSQDLSYLATTGSNVFSGSQYVSGSLVPNVDAGSFTSSFSLGSPTNAWKDIYVSHGSIVFVDAVTQATSSFSVNANQDVQYTSGITASYYQGDGSQLTNLPSTTNWNKNKEYILKQTEQLTFSGDYILENSYLEIEGGVRNSIGEWEERLSTHGGSISLTSNNQFEIVGPTATGGASDGNAITRYFDTETTMSVAYGWSGRDIGDDWPFYDIQNQYPYEYGVTNMLQDTGSNSETGTWIINIPSGSWVTFGVWTNSSNDIPGTLQITLPYLIGEDVEYSPNKFFKKEGKIFIGGNLLVKDSYIENNGQISVGGQVILMGNSQIEGTGTII